MQDASQWSSSFWGHKFYSARKSFVLQLNEIQLSFKEKNSQSFKNIETLISVINQDVDELRLAEALQNISSDFAQSGKDDEKLKLFARLVGTFLKRARLFNNFQKKRDSIKLDEQQKKEFDRRLFANEGVFYCLEYYLAVYRKLSELGELKAKEKFFGAKEIDLDFGNLPGLREDFAKDEVLEKFILLILDDTVRERLLISYFACRNVATVEKIDIVGFEKIFKKFIYYLLLSFQDNGVDKLSSKFFKPYGDEPAVKDLISIFESYE